MPLDVLFVCFDMFGVPFCLFPPRHSGQSPSGARGAARHQDPPDMGRTSRSVKTRFTRYFHRHRRHRQEYLILRTAVLNTESTIKYTPRKIPSTDILSHIYSDNLSFYLTFSLAFSVTFYLAFYLTYVYIYIYWHPIWHFIWHAD